MKANRTAILLHELLVYLFMNALRACRRRACTRILRLVNKQSNRAATANCAASQQPFSSETASIQLQPLTQQASMAAAQRWAFIVDWTDPSSGVRWTMQLFAYLTPGGAPVEVEMFDIKNRRHFLKRVKCDTVEASQLYVGSMVTVFARQLHLIAYGDEATRRAVEARSQRTLALVLPDAVQHTGRIMNAIYSSGCSIINLRMCQLSCEAAASFLQAGEYTPQQHITHLASGPVVAIEVMAPSGIRKLLDMAGPDDAACARQDAPDSIRALFGTDAVRNAIHCSDSPAAAAHELAFFFGRGGGGSNSVAGGSFSTAAAGTSRPAGSTGGSCGQSQVCSCCKCCGTTLGVVLPHAVKDGVAGLMLEEIQAAFEVTGLQLFTLPKNAAAEFLEVYKGVVPPGEFSAMVDEMTSGPCLAVEVASRDGREPVEAMRQLVGPRDPELARVLRPTTLRARFGVSRVRSSIHCTDLVEDGPLETSYFFNLLQPASTAVVLH